MFCPILVIVRFSRGHKIQNPALHLFRETGSLGDLRPFAILFSLLTLDDVGNFFMATSKAAQPEDNGVSACFLTGPDIRDPVIDCLLHNPEIFCQGHFSNFPCPQGPMWPYHRFCPVVLFSLLFRVICFVISTSLTVIMRDFLHCEIFLLQCYVTYDIFSGNRSQRLLERLCKHRKSW